MHAMSLLLNTCSGMTNRVLIDDGARWILQGDEQERENRTSWCQSSLQYAGGDHFWPCEGARETRLTDRNGVIAFGRIRERFGKTAGVAKLSDVFQFPVDIP